MVAGSGAGAESLPPTIEWAEPADGHWWDPLSWRDSTTGSPRVPTANDSVLIATFPNQTYSVFVDVRVLPLLVGQPEVIALSLPSLDSCRLHLPLGEMIG